MDTKDKIIEKAIALFNERGVNNVTSRHIADAIGISNGNFCYHFKTKESLLIAIHERMIDEISPYYQGISKSNEHSMLVFNRLILFLDQFNDKYLYFSLDLLEMSRNFPEMQKRIKKTSTRRKDQIEDFFLQFQQDNLMVKNTYRSLKHVVYSTAANWKYHAKVYDINRELTLKRCLWKIIKPHLTKEGKDFYNLNISDIKETYLQDNS